MPGFVQPSQITVQVLWHLPSVSLISAPLDYYKLGHRSSFAESGLGSSVHFNCCFVPIQLAQSCITYFLAVLHDAGLVVFFHHVDGCVKSCEMTESQLRPNKLGPSPCTSSNESWAWWHNSNLKSTSFPFLKFCTWHAAATIWKSPAFEATVLFNELHQPCKFYFPEWEYDAYLWLT